MRARHYILIAMMLLFAVSSIAGQIRFKRGTSATKPTTAAKGEPLYATDTGRLYMGMSSAGLQLIGPMQTYSGAMGYDGRSVPPLTCYIGGAGPEQITYDSTGYNPSPSSVVYPNMYVASIYVGSVGQFPIRASWSGEGIFSNTTTGMNYYPRIPASWGGVIGAGMSVQMMYSAQAVLGGKRYCVATKTVTLTKTGATGATGATGPPGLSTRKVIQDLMSSSKRANATNSPFEFSPATADRTVSPPALMKFRNYSGVLKMQVDGAGYQTFMDRNGYPVIKAGADGVLALYSNNVKWMDITPATKAVTVYRNGAAVFKIISSGKYYGQEGWPTGTKRINYTLASGFRGYTTIVGTGGGSGTPGGSDTQVQINNGGAFGGYTTFLFNKNTGQLTIHGSMVIK